MIGRGTIKKGIKYVFVTLAVGIFMLLYLPFCPFTEIETDYDNDFEYRNGVKYPLPTFDRFMYALARFTTRCSRYPYSLFLTKGTTYHNVPLSGVDSTNVKLADIRFNWDNTISINMGDEDIEFKVEKVHITPETYYINSAVEVGGFVLVEETRPTSKDSLFNAILFSDSAGNIIGIERQTEALVYGRHQVGFNFDIDGKVFGTGNDSTFNY